MLNVFPGQVEYFDSLIEDKENSYKDVLMAARKYYELCEYLEQEPTGKLQKMAYDLGKIVGQPGRKNRMKTYRNLLSAMELGEKLSRANSSQE